MDINGRVDAMDEEFKLLKNEIKQVLLEIQEHVLNVQNPFTGVGTYGFAAPEIPTRAAAAPQGGGGGMGPVTISGGGGGAMGDGQMGSAASTPQYEQGASAPHEAQSSDYVADSPQERPARAEDFADDRDDRESRREPSRQPASGGGRQRPSSERRERRRAVRPEYGDKDERSSMGREDYELDDDEMDEDIPEALARRGKRMDLITLAGVAQWTDKLIRRVGKEQTQNLLEVVANTGRITEETKGIIMALLPVFERRDTDSALSTKQLIALLAQLDGLMGTGTTADAKLLPFLLQDDTEVFPSIRQ